MKKYYDTFLEGPSGGVPLPVKEVAPTFVPTEAMKKVVADLEKEIRAITVGTVQYWKQRCINREKMDDPTYSEYERSNCRYFHSILVKKERDK